MSGPIGPRGWEEADLVKIVNTSPLWTLHRAKIHIEFASHNLLGLRGRAVRLCDIATLVCEGQAVICVELLKPIEWPYADGGTGRLYQLLASPSALARIDDAVEVLASLG
jgi:hypothetical protein